MANRVLSFAYKCFDGVVPEPGELDDEGRALLEKVEAGFETVGDLYNACKFRAALGEALALAREANVYLDRKATWFQINEDKSPAATTVYVTQSVRVVDNLKTLLAPILPTQRKKSARVPGLRWAVVRYPARGRVPGRDPLSPGADLRPLRRHRHLGKV
jgi:methionyl-tRNA synthetase